MSPGKHLTWPSAALLLVLGYQISSAGPNAGGTLVIHALEQGYSSSGQYCNTELTPTCESIVTSVDNSPEIRIFGVYAVFTDGNSPDLRGAEFGLDYDSDIFVADRGSCADFEDPQGGWPSNGTGTRITWIEGQTDQVIQLYWLAAYSYAEESGTLSLTPHPESGGHFVDSTVIPILDEIHSYGAIGFGVPGAAPCPTAQTYTISSEGGTPFPTIQSAINVAAPGSIVELQDGVFRGDGNRDISLNHTALTVRSISGNPEACIIDCQGTVGTNHRGFVFRADHNAEGVIEGIKIINGYAGSDFGFLNGGGGVDGHRNSRYTLRNCIIENCFSEFAGGGVGSAGDFELYDCIVRNNSIGGKTGAGLSADGGNIVIENCLFEDNGPVPWGGGLRFTNCDVVIRNSQFYRNTATSLGGGVSLFNTDARFEKCTWAENQAAEGGGLHALQSTIFIDQSTFSSNTASSGSCIGLASSSVLEMELSILAFGLGSSAVRCELSLVAVDLCDVFGNEGGDWVDCLEGHLGEDGNFSADPLFCEADAFDFTLNVRSPCTEPLEPDPVHLGAWPIGCADPPADIPEPVSTSEHPSGLTTSFPNPFQKHTEIRYIVPENLSPSHALGISIFDSAGRLVRRFDNVPSTPGPHAVVWNATSPLGLSMGAGVYFAHLNLPGSSDGIRLTLLR